MVMSSRTPVATSRTKPVTEAVTALAGAFVSDYAVLAGGNAKRKKNLPPGLGISRNTLLANLRALGLAFEKTLSESEHDEQKLPTSNQ
jgi:hypothetical protein